MVSARRLAQLAKKWQRMAVLGRKRLTWSSAELEKETEGPCGMSYSAVAGKGHYVVYTADRVRFKVPLVFLGTVVCGELLRLSQEVFGFAGGDGKITLPCDAAAMEYAMCLIRRSASVEMEAVFLGSMAMTLTCHYDANCAVSRVGVAQHVALCSS